MEPINFFGTTEYLEPKCPKCGTKIDYGVTTEFDDHCECHVCNKCKQKLLN